MLGNKPPYTTMQQLNLDWILSKLKTLLRLVPDDGAVGQILRRTRDGAVWSDEQGGGGGGAVESVNGQTGAVVLDAADVGALPDDYTPPVTSVNGQTGAVTVSVPVQSVNGKTGAVVLDAADVGALPDDYTPPVTSVNGQTGAVNIAPHFASFTYQAYQMGTQVTMSQLPIHDYEYSVLVIFTFANINSMYIMPTIVRIPANSQNFVLYAAWNTQTNSLISSGTVDMYITYIDY